MPLDPELIKILEEEKPFLFSFESLEAVFESEQKMDQETFAEEIRKNQIPVLHSAKAFRSFLEDNPCHVMVPYLLYREKPEDLLLSSSAMHMNWLWPSLLYIPLNISGEDHGALREIYGAALEYERVLFLNHTTPHKSNAVMQEIFGKGDGGDYLIRRKDSFIISEGNGRAIVEMVQGLLGSDDFTRATFVIVGAGGAGTLAAKAVREKNPKRIILVDLVDKSGLARELGADFFKGVEELPDLRNEWLVTIDATTRTEAEFRKSIAHDFLLKTDCFDNVFIDYNVNLPVGTYRNRKTRCAVGRQYLAITNYIMVQEIVKAAASVGIKLPPIAREDFEKKVMESLSARDQIRQRLR